MTPFNMSDMPTTKPTSNFSDIKLEDGIHDVEIEKAEYKTSTTGNPMLSVVFKTVKEKKFIFDQIMDDQTKQVNLYKLGKLLAAVKITPTGVIELKDMPRVLKKGMKLRVAIWQNGNFTNIDINKYDGYYPMETPVAAVNEAPQPTLKAADNDDTY